MTNKEAKQTVEYLAGLMKDAKKNENPLPIVFLGAGASVSAGIPLTNVIVRHIKLKYKDNYAIKNLVAQDNNNYYDVMEALTSEQRRDLFYYYITRDKVKINVTNIYLAQLLKEGYIDYILTVNFDDLILRACGLFNFLPPVYDISNVNLFTTSGYRPKSVTYLHGQYFGQWLLNKKEELTKVEEDVDMLFKQITIRRTWIVVGYSGQDRIFEHLVKLDSFSSELFWVSYLNHDPEENVMERLIKKSNANANLIKGYGSDSFFLKLHAELGDMDTPDVFKKPFSFLKELVSKVKDAKGHKPSKENEGLYLDVEKRMQISNQWINQAITEIEEEDSVEKFKQQIIDAYTKNEFENNELIFTEKIKNEEFKEAKNELADFYLIWGVYLISKHVEVKGKNNYIESIKKFEKSCDFNPGNYSVYYNWGTSLLNLGKESNDEFLYIKSIEKFKKSSELNSNDDSTYYNWAIALFDLGMIREDQSLYRKSIEMYEKSIGINPNDGYIYYNLATVHVTLGALLKDISEYQKSFDLYQKSLELNPDEKNSIFYNWSGALLQYSQLISNEQEKKRILIEGKEKAKIVVKNDGSPYNLSCAHALLEEKEEALQYLELSLKANYIDKEHVIKDKDWSAYLEDEDFIALLEKY